MKHEINPAPGDTVVTKDGREGTITKVSWSSKDGHLTTATVTTDTFECGLGEVATITKPEPPAEE